MCCYFEEKRCLMICLGGSFAPSIGPLTVPSTSSGSAQEPFRNHSGTVATAQTFKICL